MSELFRKEAVSHATRRLAGEVILATPVGARIIGGLLIGVVAIAVIFLLTASFARKETVSGWLVPNTGLIRVTARQGGLVETVQVREGQTVARGAPIATLRVSSLIDGGDSYTALAESLEAETEAAQSRALAVRLSLEAERRQLLSRRAALQRELEETRRSASLQEQRVHIAQNEVARAETIAAQGFLPRRELEARQSEALALEQALSAMRGNALAFTRDLGEVDARLAAIPIDLQAADADARTASANIQQQRTQTQVASAYTVTAVTAGQILALPVQQGQSTTPNTALAVIAPSGSVLEAELFAPSRAAGLIRPGQEVRMMYQAFPHQKYGLGRGTVISVSRTALAPNEVTVPGLAFAEPVFRLRIRLERPTVRAYGKDMALQPGMLLTADIIQERRSLMEWLLDPLYAASRQ